MTTYVLNVYAADSANANVYTCRLGAVSLTEAIEKAFKSLQLDYTEEDLEEATEYLRDEDEYAYRGGDAYIFKFESI